jgi:type II secretion system protein D
MRWHGLRAGISGDGWLMMLNNEFKRRSMQVCGVVAAAAIVLGAALVATRPSTADDATAGADRPVDPRQGATQAPLWVAQAAPAKPQAAGATPAGEERLKLSRLKAVEFHARLERALEKKLPLLASDGTAWIRFSVDAGDGVPVLVAANSETGEVSVVGRQEQLRAWRQIVAALDGAPPAGKVTQLVSADQASAPKIRQTVDVLLAQAQAPAPAPGQPAQVAPVQPGSAAAAAIGQIGHLLGPVEIINVEGTDLFIIVGNPRDVQQVEEVIQQIEEMSRVSEPQVVVHPLEHVDSQSIAVLLQQMFAPAEEGGFSLGAYYGSLLSLPLGKPNALLLVGSPSAVEKAKEFLKQLDVAGEAMTQFEVFRLKNATAEQARVVVEQLFAATAAENTTVAPAPLGPKALVIAEPRTNSLIVRAGPRDMEEVRALIHEIDSPGGERVNEMRVFRLKSALAGELAPVLQRAIRGEAGSGDNPDADARVASLLRMVTIDAEGQQQLQSGVLAGVTINADTQANSLIVSGPPESMQLIAAIIAELDQPPDAVAELKVFTIQNGDAVSLADMLRELFGTGEQSTDQGGGGATNQGPAQGLFNLRFSVDERTNSIIVAGSADELVTVEAVLLRLDSSDSRQRINRVYKLKNADAEQVAIALQEWLQQKRDVELTAPGATSPFQQIESEVVVVAEINSNSLIVSATPSYYNEITTIVQQLDEQAPMVMIQVLIGEVTLGDADEFGVELGLQDSVLFDRSLIEEQGFITTNSTTINQTAGGATTQVEQQIIQSAPLTPGFNFGDPARPLGNSGSTQALRTAGTVGAQSLSSFAVGRVNPALGFGGMVLSASSDSVSMLLRALQESRRLEVLSRPQIVALDNLEGRTFVGEIVPIVSDVVFDTLGRPQIIPEQVPVGLELRVRPRISPDNLVVMEVAALKQELGPLDQGIPIAVAANGDPIRVPRINSIEAQTTVSAVSGQTVVLSGLLTTRDDDLHRRVPLLADIPLVGDLFRYDSHIQTKRELLIILTPHVIRNRQDAEIIKQVESARMSWCLSDVVDLHGPSGLRSRTDPIGAAEAETVYPQAAPGEMGYLAPDLADPSLPMMQDAAPQYTLPPGAETLPAPAPPVLTPPQG